jgi:hypothetical protein
VDGCHVFTAAQVDEDRHAFFVAQAPTKLVGQLSRELSAHG